MESWCSLKSLRVEQTLRDRLGTVSSIETVNALLFTGLTAFKESARDALTRFWEDPWMGETPLALQYPRLYNIV